MAIIKKAIKYYSKKAREKRASIFREAFSFNEHTKILDLGSENGSNINAVLNGLNVKPDNIYIADINETAINRGASSFGYVPVLISEDGPLAFPDNYFDIVYCSSVIEHVTLPKEKIWTVYSGKVFRDQSLVRQSAFSEEIKRLGKQYFVQTPYRYFPIESHSWLPFLSWMPRRLIIAILSVTNKFWVKKTTPDWYLLTKPEMLDMFDGAQIIDEKFVGLTKSIMAIKSSKK